MGAGAIGMVVLAVVVVGVLRETVEIEPSSTDLSRLFRFARFSFEIFYRSMDRFGLVWMNSDALID